MRFFEFEHAARTAWDDIPDTYREGVDGLIVDRSVRAHPDEPDVYTLGECVTEEYPSQYGGPDTIRSAVVLYWGSFVALARDDEEFDWEAEIRDTIMHELQHHLESLATEDSLEALDYAVDQNFKRARGAAFDPFFYRAGEVAPALQVADAKAFRVERDVFIEIVTRGREAFAFEFGWDGIRYRAPIPQAAHDVTFVRLEPGPDLPDGEFHLVRVVRQGMVAALRSALASRYTVQQTSAAAELVA